MADGIHTAVVDLADALIERWIGMSARDVAAVVRSKNAEEFRRVKKVRVWVGRTKPAPSSLF